MGMGSKNVVETGAAPGKNEGGLTKGTCKAVKQEDNREKRPGGPRGPWVGYETNWEMSF
jgi:hypothetical protein